MDNGQIEGLLVYQPPWKGELAKWEAQRKQTQVSASTVDEKYGTFNASVFSLVHRLFT